MYIYIQCMLAPISNSSKHNRWIISMMIGYHACALQTKNKSNLTKH